MSIAALKKVTLVGIANEKDIALSDLQNLGVIHLIDISNQSLSNSQKQADPFKDNHEALAFLESCTLQQRPLRRRPKQFQPDVAIAQVLRLKARTGQLRDEAESIQNQIELLKPWGDFNLPAPKDLHGLQMYFYVISYRGLKKIIEANLAYEVVNQDPRYLYVVVIADTSPDIPFIPIAIPQDSLSQLHEKLEFTLDELEKCETRRVGETRIASLLREHLNQSLDRSELLTAAQKAYDHAGLFALQGWCPVDLVESLQVMAEARSLACEITDPSADETPPTCIENHDLIAPGEILTGFFSTPNYKGWDPSLVVYFSFIIFFGMIMSDAGYGFILLGIIFFLRSRLIASGQRNFFRMGLALSISTCVYGVLAGSYFGLNPKQIPPKWLGGFLGHLELFDGVDLKNLSIMMAVSIFVGCLHILLANTISLYNHRNSQKAIANFGWIVIIISGFSAWLTRFFFALPTLSDFLLDILAAGVVLVFLFTHPAPLTRQGLFDRLKGGLHGVYHITKVFGDILSYLRLFALGLAGSYLAITFNQLAHDAAKLGEFGFLLSFFIIVCGHGVNFALAVMGGVIHGLRLNFIEFYDWSVEGEGFKFLPFQKAIKNK